MTLVQLFDVATLFVLPFWALMILLPNWGVTRRVMESYVPFVALALLYLYFFVSSITPETLALFTPRLANITQLFADERAVAAGWTHFVVVDLFVGRWIYWEGQRMGIWTTHSLVVCLFAGPFGLLSHTLTRWLSQRFFPRSNGEAAAIADQVTSSSGTLSA
ncbi:DUF4281 domain-containing protein [Nostoc sp. UHCC 0702]|nr:DUF4281 domain-containing protein [Nostoc sp. UHCC 0702]